MFSRLAFTRAGSFGQVHSGEKHWRLVVTGTKVRNSSNVPVEGHRTLPTETASVHETLVKWKDAQSTYFGLERDTVNFPHKICPETNPPVRVGFIPDTWFQAFYNKTGVTGPYMFGGGLITYLLSKEIWIVEHNFNHFLAFWGAVYLIQRKYGATIANYLDKQRDELLENKWFSRKSETKSSFENQIKELDKSIWQEEGQKYLFQAKRENVDLQLESQYRQRLNEVYREVKKRLDYQVDVQTAERRIEQQHMVQWIVNGVMASITPQQEKDSLTKCLSDLKALSTKVPVV